MFGLHVCMCAMCVPGEVKRQQWIPRTEVMLIRYHVGV